MPFRPDQVPRSYHTDTVIVYLYGQETGYLFSRDKYERLQHFFQTAEHRETIEIEGFYGHVLNLMRGDIQLVMYASAAAKEKNNLDAALTAKELEDDDD